MGYYTTERSKQIYSREFLGVTLVRLTGSPRRAERVVSDHRVAALLPNGKVAIDAGCGAFDANWGRSGYEQTAVARTLAALGVITKEQCRGFCEKEAAAKVRRQREHAANDMEQAAHRLGLELTKGQRRAIEALTKVTA